MVKVSASVDLLVQFPWQALGTDCGQLKAGTGKLLLD